MMAADKLFWNLFPLEIQLLILRALTQDGCSMARYASVCRHWQMVIERKTFSCVKVTPSRLSSFEKTVERRKELVKSIWLCMELQTYDCSQCEEAETDLWHENNTQIISNTIRDFFSILASWKPDGRLLLDIGAYSLSDSEHHFKYLQLGSNSTSDSNELSAPTHDPVHGWSHGTQTNLPPKNSIYRLFEDIEMDDNYWDNMPEVTAVTSLLLRRQTRRRWEPWSLARLIQLLPRLDEIHYEPWREWSRIEQEMTDESKMLLECLRAVFLLIIGIC
jgi:hypothetical protein